MIRRIFRFPAEPSIVGFIFFATILGVISADSIDPYKVILLFILQLHLAFTIDNVYRGRRLLDISGIYTFTVNVIPYLILAIYDYDVLYSLIPLAVLFILTTYLVRTYGREYTLSTIVGTIFLSYMVVTSSAVVGYITRSTMNLWVVYMLYLSISVIYVEGRIGKIGSSYPAILSVAASIIYYLLNPIYILITVDLNAKTFELLITRERISEDRITEIGVLEMKRLIAFSAILIAINLFT